MCTCLILCSKFYSICSHEKASVSMTFSRMESAMYKWRNRNCPPAVHSMPTYTQEVNSDNWKHLLQCKRGTMNVSLVIGDDSSESVIFMNPEFVRETSVRGFFS